MDWDIFCYEYVRYVTIIVFFSNVRYAPRIYVILFGKNIRIYINIESKLQETISPWQHKISQGQSGDVLGHSQDDMDVLKMSLGYSLEGRAV